MQAAINQFRTNLLRVRNLGSIVHALESQTTQALDLSDILRAEFVLAVSALDQFVHEAVRLGMLDSYKGNRARTQTFLRFQVSLESALEGMGGGSEEQWLDDQVRLRNGYRSFQTPDGIADAVRLISEVRLWDEVSQRMGDSSQGVREKLSLIADRRNKIAHEADINPSPYEDLWPIDRQTVNDAVDFIESIVESIHLIIA